MRRRLSQYMAKMVILEKELLKKVLINLQTIHSILNVWILVKLLKSKLNTITQALKRYSQ